MTTGSTPRSGIVASWTCRCRRTESGSCLRFGAVDYHATVWLDNIRVGEHEGGYTPFSFDVTELLRDGHRVLTVRAYDNPLDLEQPRGKQDWEVTPHLIWYPRTTGIWQTVWLEQLPVSFIDQVSFTPNMDRWEISMHVTVDGRVRSPLYLHVRLQVGDVLLAHDSYLVLGQIVHRRIALSDPGIDDSRNDFLWSPASPVLIDVVLELKDGEGNTLDQVRSYTALREIATQGDRVILNGRAYRLRMVLDQGYWPDSGMTAPDELALKRDVELAKAMGFNGVRKHQKIEDPRYLYWCDRLGLLVWEEMPSAYRFTARSVRRLQKEWEEVIRATRATRALPRGCHSTSHGAFPTCLTAPRSGTTCRRCITSRRRSTPRGR